MSEETAKKQRGTPFTKNDPRINKEGRPLGSKNEKSFVEFYDEIAEDIAKQNNMSVEDVKKVIYKVGYAKAKEGNYSFYKDILDRVHGQAKQSIDVEAKDTKGNTYNLFFSKEIQADVALLESKIKERLTQKNVQEN